MYTLPSNVRMTIRKVEKPLRAFIVTCVKKWSGDKLSVFITDRVDKTTGHELFCRVDLTRGEITWIKHFDGRRHYIAIAPDEAIVKLAHPYGLDDGEVTVYLHAFTGSPTVEDELGVARDAILEGDLSTAHRIAKRALPHAFALFEALVRHEQRLMPRLRLHE